MDFDEPQRLDLVGYDEKSESWFVQPKDSQRLLLTRTSLARLVQMYNSIHQGRPLALIERSELRRLEAAQREQTILTDELRFQLARRPTLRGLSRRLPRAFADWAGTVGLAITRWLAPNLRRPAP